MILDDPELYQQLDPDGMLDHIDALPNQIEDAWQYAQIMPLPNIDNVTRIVTCGMGGSAIGG